MARDDRPIVIVGADLAGLRAVEDDGRRFLAHYRADGVLTAVVGAGMAGKVMEARAVPPQTSVNASRGPGIPTSTRA